MALDWLLQPILVLFAVFLTLISSTLSVSDSEALIKLKNSFANADALGSWVSISSPCEGNAHWNGVICYNGVVSGLRLENMGLSGKIDVDALAEILGLRSVSFAHNSFSGSIPELNRLSYLKAIFLTGNQFSGEIPSDYFSRMQMLKKVWLSDNMFTGTIPASLSGLPHLMELRLENNQFVGTIPFLDQPTLMSFNVSNNNLVGEVPPSVARFKSNAFDGNADLCLDSSHGCSSEFVTTLSSTGDQPGQKHGKRKNILGGVITLVVLLLCAAAVLVFTRKRKGNDHDMLGKGRNAAEKVEVQVSSMDMQSTKRSGSSRRGSNRGGAGELVMVNDKMGVFGLPDLMKASAEVLGNGGLGSAYKARMANGVTVVVKRMREMNALGKGGFSAEIRKLGTLQHINIMTPLAFHYRRDEKLIVYEYIPEGSLLYMLHGDRGPSHAELDWPARFKIVRGIARGLDYLHTELASSKLPHGNLKSSNIFLGPDNEPLLSEFGFSTLVSSSLVSQALISYKAPEAMHSGTSPKCDVYCLGIIILEILTGKFPSIYLSNASGGTDVVLWVESAISESKEIEVLDPEIARSTTSTEQMKQLLHIGVACTENNPEHRLDIREVVERIEGMGLEGGGGGGGGGYQTQTMEVTTLQHDDYVDAPQNIESNLHE